MKKEFRKKFYLVAMIASLALLCGGGVTSCSNGNDDDEPKDEKQPTETVYKEFGDNDEILVATAEKFAGEIESISIEVTNIDDNAITYDNDGNPQWWFWAKTDDGTGDDLVWKDSLNGFFLEVTDATKIAYIKQNGLNIKGLAKLKAKISYTVKEKELATPPVVDNDEIKIVEFMRGFDASEIDFNEKDGGKTYKDTDGTTKDVFEILKSHGVNTIRLRLWVDPSETNLAQIAAGDNYANLEHTGGNDLARTIRLAKRAKAAGLCVMLDFHYSDYWTDPAKQIIPNSWQSITSADEMAAKIGEYTTEVLNAMKDAKCTPDYVQVGNEIDSGILLHKSWNGTKATDAAEAIKGTMSDQTSSNFAKYIAAGCQAVRDFNDKIQIILHVTNRRADFVTKLVSAMSENSALYDIIGLSYYPWENHRTISELKANIAAIKAEGKKALVAETSMPWNYDSNSEDKLNKVHTQMVDPKTNSVYADLSTETVSGEDIVKGSLQNQYNVIAHIMNEVSTSDGIGVCAWGGARLGDWTYSFFDSDGKAMSSIDVFKYELGAKLEKEDEPKDEEIPTPSATTGTLTLKFEGFTISGGSINVNYGAKNGTYTDATGMVAQDGKSATVTVEKKYADADGWFNNITITVKDSSGTEVKPSYDNWFEFKEDGTELTLKVVTGTFTEITKDKSVTLSEGWETYTEAISANDLNSASGATAIKIEVGGITSEKVCVYASATVNTNWLADITKDSGSCTISEADKISNILSNGIHLCSGSAEKVTVTVSYTK